MFDRKFVAGGESVCISTVEVVMRPLEVFVRLTRWSLDRLSAHLAEPGCGGLPDPSLAAAGRGWAVVSAHPLVEGQPGPRLETRAARVLELYGAAPIDGPVISFDHMGPISLKPI